MNYELTAELIQALEALCAAWAQENKDVTQLIETNQLTVAESMNAIAHMTERRKCESALEDIIREAKGKR